MGVVIDRYSVLLRRMLERPLVTVVAWLVCMAGTVFFFAVLPQSFLPEGDSGAIIGQMMMPLGTSSERIRAFQDKIDKTLLEDPAVERIITVTGTQPGADQSTGPVVIVLKEKGKRPPMQKVVARLRGKLAMIPDGAVFLKAIPTLSIP